MFKKGGKVDTGDCTLMVMTAIWKYFGLECSEDLVSLTVEELEFVFRVISMRHSKLK